MRFVNMTWFQLLRPYQWLKNLMLLFPPFLSGDLFHVESFAVLLIPLVSFSLSASSVYIINDIMDVKQDVHHPVKKYRPLPSGRIKTGRAVAIACLLILVSVCLAVYISLPFLLILAAYLVISNGYSLFLKSIPVLELFCIVTAFLLRLEAGGVAYHVQISDWLFLSVFLLALFLISGKRLSELIYSDGQAPGLIRPVLMEYPDGFFQAGMYISGSAVLMTYTMYVINHHGNLFLIPLCCFGLLQYMLRVLSGRGGDPTRALTQEPVLFWVGLLWVIMVGFNIYG